MLSGFCIELIPLIFLYGLTCIWLLYKIYTVKTIRKAFKYYTLTLTIILGITLLWSFLYFKLYGI